MSITREDLKEIYSRQNKIAECPDKSDQFDLYAKYFDRLLAFAEEEINRALCLEHNEFLVFHVFKHDDYSQHVREYHFWFDENGQDIGDNSFDVRDLDAWPAPGNDVTRTLKLAIESGELQRLRAELLDY